MNIYRYEEEKETIQTQDVRLSDTHHKSDKEQKTQIKTSRKSKFEKRH